MATYIFLTTDGTEQDGAGEEANNCQVLGIIKGPDVLTAYNTMLEDGVPGDYDSCFAYELAGEARQGQFDLINDTEDEDGLCGANFEIAEEE